MALDNIDARIPLGAGQPSGPFGPDLRQLITMQELAQRIQLQNQSIQGQNFLKQLYGDPANVGADNQLKPQAVNRLMGVSPSTGFEYLHNRQGMEVQKARMQFAQSQLSDEVMRKRNEINRATSTIYDDTLKKSGPEAAQRAAQQTYTEMLPDLAQLVDPQQRQQMNPQFDRGRAAQNMAAYDAMTAKPITPLQQEEEARKGQELQLRAAETAAKIESERTKETIYRGKDAEGKDVQARLGRSGGFERIGGPNAGQPVELTGIEKVGAKGEAGGLSPSKEITIRDKDGNPIERFAARESKNEVGWVREDGTPVVLPPGGHIDVGAAGGTILGSRESTLLQRQLGAGVQAMKAIKDVVALPTTTSTGFFGGRVQGPGLMDAAKERLTTRLSSQEVQAYNAIMPGMSRSLALIDSQGLAPGAKFTDSFNAEMLTDSDTLQTKMLKLARQREIVEGGMETLLANDRVGQAQKKKAEEVMAQIKEAIPWTPLDVIRLMASQNPQATLKDFAGKTGLAPEGGAAAALPPAPGGIVSMPADRDAQIKAWQDAAPGTRFTFPDGSEKVK